MRVVVVPHEVVRPLLRQWRDSLSDDADERAALFELFWAELVRRVTQHAGPPPEAFREPNIAATAFWCELAGGTWVRLTVGEDAWGLLQGTVRKFVVTDLAPRPPAGTRPRTP